eukprot:1610798-Lingulodinium_polyedra.AAC.1
MQRFLVHYQHLAHVNLQAGRRLFYVTPKGFHYPWHIGHVCRWYNPRAGWTYVDEDFMGRIADLASKSVFGRGPTRVSDGYLL